MALALQPINHLTQHLKNLQHSTDLTITLKKITVNAMSKYQLTAHKITSCPQILKIQLFLFSNTLAYCRKVSVYGCKKCMTLGTGENLDFVSSAICQHLHQGPTL
jgi:hypothetical protein